MPPTATERPPAREWIKCRKSFAYFADVYCHILSGEDDAEGSQWVPFRLWPMQRKAADLLQREKLVVILKARQIGLTWLAVCFVLWLALFHPACTALLFSRRDVEAVKLLARLRGVYARLPPWMRARGPLPVDSGHDWQLPTGSEVMAFPTTAGDSYTANVVVADEFDLVRDQNALLAAVKPTVSTGGRLVLLSRPDKVQPESAFKRIYRGARAGTNGWSPLFLPWQAHPGRDEAWHRTQAAEIWARTGSADELHEQYPATEAEALSPRSLDKRIPSAWLEAVTRGCAPLPNLPRGSPALPGLEVYRLPSPGRRYAVGADPAEGNPTSDDSAAVVLEVESGEEVAALAGKFQPDPFADYVAAVARWFNRAPVLVERNNHGHAVLSRLRSNGTRRLLHRDGKEGWLTTQKSKAELWDLCAESVREGEVIIRSLATFHQLASIDGNTLSAPEGQHDDRAVAFALANAARAKAGGKVEAPTEDNRNVAALAPEGVFG